MDLKSRHIFDSDESDLDVQAEINGKCGMVENDLYKGMDLYVGEHDKIDEQSVEDFPPNAEAFEPYIGMQFVSRDEAREFYSVYGRHTGFTVRIHHNCRSRVNNQVIGQDFVCSKEGFRAKKYLRRKDRVFPAPPITREGCQAMIRLSIRKGGKWVITKFVKEHNHLLMSPSRVPWRGFGKHLVSEDEKDRRIRELSIQLYNERQRCKRKCAAYEEQLKMIINDLEIHTEQISSRITDVVKNIREIEVDPKDYSKNR